VETQETNTRENPARKKTKIVLMQKKHGVKRKNSTKGAFTACKKKIREDKHEEGKIKEEKAGRAGTLHWEEKKTKTVRPATSKPAPGEKRVTVPKTQRVLWPPCGPKRKTREKSPKQKEIGTVEKKGRPAEVQKTRGKK